MTTAHRRRAVVVATLVVLAGGCGSDDAGGTERDEASTVVADDDLTCDHDVSSPTAKGWVERVGGRRGEGYQVTFARSTPLGVVALVEGDAQAAYDDLNTVADVTEVAVLQPDRDPETISGFSQVADLVTATCG